MDVDGRSEEGGRDGWMQAADGGGIAAADAAHVEALFLAVLFRAPCLLHVLNGTMIVAE